MAYEPGSVVYRGSKPMGGQYGTMGGSMGGYDIEGIRPPSDKSLLRRGDMEPEDYEEANKVNMCELVLLPWALLALVLGCYLVAGANGQIAVLWIMPVVLTILIVGFIGSSYRKGDSDEVVLGFLTLTAVAIGTAVGLFGNLTMLQELHRINQGASYFNVLPAESATSKLDASSMVFVNGTRVNVGEAFSFTDASSALATVYCVAPVTNGETSFKRIQYWAAGIDCCGQTKPFTCGAATAPAAKGGLRLSPLVEAPGKEFFEKAVKGAVEKYDLIAGNDYVLLNWMEDPIRYRDELWSGSWKLFVVFAGVYLLISAMVGFVVFPILKGS